jgi:drug/metabolite transporter (DMT)-like permease
MAWGNALTAAIALPLAGFTGAGFAAPTAASMAKVLFLGFIQIGLAWYLFDRALRMVRAIEASFITMAEPVACPLWSFLILGERPDVAAVAGGALIVTTLTAHTAAARARP